MKKSAAAIVADNLRGLMQGSTHLNSPQKLARRVHTSKSTIERIRDGQVACRIDNLAAIAAAYGLEPWQMLVDGLEPANPPMLRAEDEKLKALYRQLALAMDNLRRYDPGRDP